MTFKENESLHHEGPVYVVHSRKSHGLSLAGKKHQVYIVVLLVHSTSANYYTYIILQKREKQQL